MYLRINLIVNLENHKKNAESKLYKAMLMTLAQSWVLALLALSIFQKSHIKKKSYLQQ